MGESCEGVVATPLTRKHFLLDDNQCEGDSDSKVYLIYFPLLFSFFLKPFKCGLVLHDFCWGFFFHSEKTCVISCYGYTKSGCEINTACSRFSVHSFVVKGTPRLLLSLSSRSRAYLFTCLFCLLNCYTSSFSGCKSFQTMIVFLDALCERARK